MYAAALLLRVARKLAAAGFCPGSLVCPHRGPVLSVTVISFAPRALRRCAPCRGVVEVEQFVQAARKDGVGTFAAGALERLLAASEEALKSINASSAA